MINFLIGGTEKVLFYPKWIYCLSNSGREEEDREAHIKELCMNGVPHPEEAQLDFYPVPSLFLTQDSNIEVLGRNTTGEVEVVLFMAEGTLYVTVGSDHGDRRLEASSSDLTKQVCAKPVALEAWPLEEVLPHWDQLVLRCEVMKEGMVLPYQHGTLDFLLHPEKVLEEIRNRHLPMEDGCAYFCGTLLMRDSKFQPGDGYHLYLEDGILGRKIEHSYTVTALRDQITYFKI